MSTETRPTMRRATALAATVLAASLAAAGAAEAGGGYSNVCRAVNPSFELNDGELVVDSAYAGRDVAFEITRETVIREIRAECIAASDPEQRFGWSLKVSVVTGKLTVDDQEYMVEMLCEEASDGVPAAYSCAGDDILYQGGIHIDAQ